MTTLLLTDKSELTKYQESVGGKYYTTNRQKSAYQTMTIGKVTCTFLATLPTLFKMIAEVETTQSEKVRITVARLPQLHLFNYKEEVRIGSHKEFIPRIIWNNGNPIKDEKHGFNQIITDYETVYHDCLVSKEWLQEHENDVIPEPTIDIVVDGKEFHVNGNYKSGLIKGHMAQFGKVTRKRKVTSLELAGVA